MSFYCPRCLLQVLSITLLELVLTVIVCVYTCTVTCCLDRDFLFTECACGWNYLCLVGLAGFSMGSGWTYKEFIAI